MKIEFTIEQIGILDQAVQQLPYYIAAPLIAHINKQIAEQKQAMDKPIDQLNVLHQVDQTAVESEPRA